MERFGKFVILYLGYLGFDYLMDALGQGKLTELGWKSCVALPIAAILLFRDRRSTKPA